MIEDRVTLIQMEGLLQGDLRSRQGGHPWHKGVALGPCCISGVLALTSLLLWLQHHLHSSA